jgi:hypothetical protein
MACFSSVCEAICWCCLPPTATRTKRRGEKIASQSRVERGKKPELRIHIAIFFFFWQKAATQVEGGGASRKWTGWSGAEAEAEADERKSTS